MIGKTPIVFSAPNTEPSTVGKRLKKEPQPMPFITAKTAKTPILEENGQITRALTLHSTSETKKLLRGPRNESAVYPAKTRPTVDAKFQMVRAMMAVFADELMERAKTGRKYGGMKRGKQPSAVPKKRMRKSGSLKRRLLKQVRLCETRKLKLGYSPL